MNSWIWYLTSRYPCDSNISFLIVQGEVSNVLGHGFLGQDSNLQFATLFVISTNCNLMLNFELCNTQEP